MVGKSPAEDEAEVMQKEGPNSDTSASHGDTILLHQKQHDGWGINSIARNIYMSRDWQGDSGRITAQLSSASTARCCQCTFARRKQKVHEEIFRGLAGEPSPK